MNGLRNSDLAFAQAVDTHMGHVLDAAQEVLVYGEDPALRALASTLIDTAGAMRKTARDYVTKKDSSTASANINGGSGGTY